MKKKTAEMLEKELKAAKTEIKKLLNAPKTEIAAPKVTKLNRDAMFVEMEYNGKNIYGTLVNAYINHQTGARIFYLQGADGQIRQFNKERVAEIDRAELEEKVQELMAVKSAVAAKSRIDDLFAA